MRINLIIEAAQNDFSSIAQQRASLGPTANAVAYDPAINGFRYSTPGGHSSAEGQRMGPAFDQQYRGKSHLFREWDR